jgi:1-acyl-sn-glycerol-3-phosphate acyltransferase
MKLWRRKKSRNTPHQETEDLSAHAPGSSRQRDALVGPLSEEEVEKIAGKKLRIYAFVHFVLRAPVRWVLRARGENADRVPRRGGAILVVNHASSFDPPALLVVMKRPYITLANAGIMAKPVKRFFLEFLGGMIRVDRSKGGNEAAVKAACEAVENGKILAVWPEGGRSPTGQLTRGRTGVARIAMKTGAPVIPVAVLGTYEKKPKHEKKIDWSAPVTVRFGHTMRFAGRSHEADDRDTARQVTDQIMREVARLQGPGQVDHYDRLVELDVAPGHLPPSLADSEATARDPRKLEPLANQ